MSSSQSAGPPTRFDRKKYFPNCWPWNTRTEEFCALFPNRYAYINKPLTGGDWFSANERWQLSDSQILKAIACAHKKYFIGLRPGRATRIAVLDIDIDSKYHSLEYFNKIKMVLAQAGIHTLVPYRSSTSNGWHLYIFFDQAISSRDLHKQLTQLMELNQVEVQKGQLEIFPNPGQTNSLGFGLRLPMQPGWAWLCPETMELKTDREELTALEALELFLFDLDNCSNSQHDFHRLKRYVEDMLDAQGNNLPKPEKKIRPGKKDNVVSIHREVANAAPESTGVVCAVFGQVPQGMHADVWLNGRKFFAAGLSGPGQRAEAIFSLSHYLFYGDPERDIVALGYGREQERQCLLEEILAAKHNGKSKDINKGRADALEQISRAANWRPLAKQAGEHKPFSVEVPISWVLENERRRFEARSRIELALEELKGAGQAITASSVRQLAKCSWTTLYKHEDLWRPPAQAAELVLEPLAAYEQVAAPFFEFSTHEYNDLFAAVPGSLVPNSESWVDPASSSLTAVDLADSIAASPTVLCAETSNRELLASNTLDFRRVVPLQQQLLLSLCEFSKLVSLILLLCFCSLFRPLLQPWSLRYLRRKRYTRMLFRDLNIEPP